MWTPCSLLYGFPRERSGPMYYADTVGLDTILADIRTFARDDPCSATVAPAGGPGGAGRNIRQPQPPTG